jgi:serine/threonine-protein phosphatase 5
MLIYAYPVVVEDSYVGPHLQDGVVTLEFVEQIQEHFKNQKVLHKKYAMQILIQAKALFKYEQNLFHHGDY